MRAALACWPPFTVLCCPRLLAAAPTAMTRASLLLLASAASAAGVGASSVSVAYDASAVLHTVGEHFVAFNIDTGCIYNSFDFSNTKLINLVKALAPTAIRIGGTAADAALYLPASTLHSIGTSTTVVSDSTWDDIVAFILATNTTLLWNLNRKSFVDGNGAWQPARNATPFLAYTQAKYPGLNIWWSVGNEPSGVPAAELAQYALTLKSLLAQFNVGTAVYGPAYGNTGDAGIPAYLSASRGTDGFTVRAPVATARKATSSTCAVE